MRFTSLFNAGRALGVGLLLAAACQPAVAQLLPAAHAQAYDFLTVTTVEAQTRNMAKLLFAPAFGGRREISLEPIGGFSAATLLEQLRKNNEVLAQTLSELSAAGWELIQVETAPFIGDKTVTTTRYLLRKAKT
jgi:hypothetical protein